MNRCPHAEDAFPECEPCHIRRLEREVDALARICGVVIVIGTLEPGEELVDAPEHAAVSVALTLRSERDAARAKVAVESPGRGGWKPLCAEHPDVDCESECIGRVRCSKDCGVGDAAPAERHRWGCSKQNALRRRSAALTAAAAATTDGIATGLSRALVALEERAAKLDEHGIYPEHMEASRCAGIVRELLEALVDGPTDPGEKLAQR